MVQSPFKFALGYAILGFAALGCGSDSSSGKKPVILEAPQVTGTAASLNLVSKSSDERLQGLWQTGCLENGDGSSSRLTVEITEDYLQQTTSLFRGLGCIGLAMDARFINSYEARDGMLQTTLKQAHLNVYNRLYAQAAEAGSSCGYNRWQTNVWYDLTNKNCVKGENGVWLSPTRAGTKVSSSFSIFVSNAGAELDLNGVTLKRPKREADTPAQPPQIDPVLGFLFADRKAQALESFLKTWGCTISLELGVSDCPAPKDLDGAGRLIDQLIEFGHSITADVNFKGNKEAQDRLKKGYTIEMSKVHAYPPYADVVITMREGLKLLQIDHPRYKFGEFYNANAVKAIKGLGTLRNAFGSLDLDQELERLGVSTIYVTDARTYGGMFGDAFIMWDGESSAQEMINYLKGCSPIPKPSDRISSFMPQSSRGLGFEATFQ